MIEHDSRYGVGGVAHHVKPISTGHELNFCRTVNDDM